LICQLKQEVGGEAVEVALDRLHEHPGGHAAQHREIGIEHLVPPNEADHAADPFGGHPCVRPGHESVLP
jgi:hypothetical protein